MQCVAKRSHCINWCWTKPTPPLLQVWLESHLTHIDATAYASRQYIFPVFRWLWHDITVWVRKKYDSTSQTYLHDLMHARRVMKIFLFANTEHCPMNFTIKQICETRSVLQIMGRRCWWRLKASMSTRGRFTRFVRVTKRIWPQQKPPSRGSCQIHRLVSGSSPAHQKRSIEV